jgi:hypothetical protein
MILNACFPHHCLFDITLTFSRFTIPSFLKLGLCMTLSVRTDKSIITYITMLLFCWHWADATVHNQFMFHIISCGSFYLSSRIFDRTSREDSFKGNVFHSIFTMNYSGPASNRSIPPGSSFACSRNTLTAYDCAWNVWGIGVSYVFQQLGFSF